MHIKHAILKYAIVPHKLKKSKIISTFKISKNEFRFKFLRKFKQFNFKPRG